MINLYLVRHGQTETNLKQLVCGQTDTKMTELGYDQIEKSSKKLHSVSFDHFYSSPLIRATESAKYFDSLEKFETCDELMEMNTGDYSHLTVDELWHLEPKHKYQGRYKYQKYPSGESLSILYNRIVTWFNHHLHYTWNHGDNILIIGHEATVVCAIHHFLRMPLENYPSFKIANGGIVRIECNTLENQCRVEFL